MFFSNQLNNISNLKHCFFSRKNGVSKGIYNSLNCGLNSNDDKKNVIQNINIVCKKLNCEKKPIITLNQTHGNKVVCFNNPEEIKNKINAKKMSIFTITFLIFISYLLSNIGGLIILLVASLIGYLPYKLKTTKTILMGSLMIPTLIFYFSRMI